MHEMLYNFYHYNKKLFNKQVVDKNIFLDIFSKICKINKNYNAIIIYLIILHIINHLIQQFHERIFISNN